MDDIFERVHVKIGCLYLSDLRQYKDRVWDVLYRIPLEKYPKRQLEDFSQYVFGVPYQRVKEGLDRGDLTPP